MKRRNLSNFSPTQAPNPTIRRCFGTRRVINHHFSAFGMDFSLCGRPSPTKNSRHACQVVSRKGNGLSPTKYFLDSFANDQTCLVSGMPGGTTINSTSLGFFSTWGVTHGRALPVQIYAHRTICLLPRWPVFSDRANPSWSLPLPSQRFRKHAWFRHPLPVHSDFP